MSEVVTIGPFEVDGVTGENDAVKMHFKPTSWKKVRLKKNKRSPPQATGYSGGNYFENPPHPLFQRGNLMR